jgi:hypothetical protein
VANSKNSQNSCPQLARSNEPDNRDINAPEGPTARMIDRSDYGTYLDERQSS